MEVVSAAHIFVVSLLAGFVVLIDLRSRVCNEPAENRSRSERGDAQRNMMNKPGECPFMPFSFLAAAAADPAFEAAAAAAGREPEPEPEPEPPSDMAIEDADWRRPSGLSCCSALTDGSGFAAAESELEAEPRAGEPLNRPLISPKTPPRAGLAEAAALPLLPASDEPEPQPEPEPEPAPAPLSLAERQTPKRGTG